MMRNTTPIGPNRTGIDLSPVHKRELIDAAEHTPPSAAGDDTEIAQVRAAYAEQAEPLGSMPPPTTIKQAAGTIAGMVKGDNLAVLLDKLGERLAFERTGSRLYEALVVKHQSSEPLAGGPATDDLERMLEQEIAHFELVRDVIEQLGGDPTALTPSADVASVTTLGVLQAVEDPRTSLKQALQTMLVAELVDNDGWALLVELARALGKDDIAARLQVALDEEDVHLADVRRWVTQSTMDEARATFHT